MGDFVLDTSVTMAWCFEDEASPYADAVLKQLANAQALAPVIWPLEVCNVLAVAERRGRISPAASARFLGLLQHLPITVENAIAERLLTAVIALAREQALSTYDAAYLDLAMQNGLPLATLDENLRQAARRCGVEVALL